LARLALFCVLSHGFLWFSAGFGPKLDPSFWHEPLTTKGVFSLEGCAQ
jgi:hypothetical protein